MPEWMISLFGIELPPLPPGGQRHLEFPGLPKGENLLFLLLFFGALIAVTLRNYDKEGHAPTWQKYSLAALRILTILVAMLVLSQPQLSLEIEKTLDSATVVLVDDSLSMSIKDRLDREQLKKDLSAVTGVKDYDLSQFQRSQLLEKMLNNKELNLIKRLNEKNKVRLFSFGQKTVELPWTEEKSEVKVSPSGQFTDLSGGVRGALEEVRGKTIAGVVVFSDGRVNSGEYPNAVAGWLKEQRIPLYTVGIGNPDPPKNYEVLELVAPPRVYKNDPVLFQGQIRATGYMGRKVRVILEALNRANDSTQTISEQNVEIKSPRFQAKVAFKITPKIAGEFLYSLKIEPLEDELTADDNAISRVLHVIEDDTRVLVIGGAPTFEFRFLRNLLIRERTIQVSTWLQSADEDFPQDGNLRIRKLPRTQEELFKYDVVILIDPREDALDRPWLELLSRFVERHGGGLCYVAGDKHTTSMFRNSDFTPLHRLLPVEPDLEKAEALNLPGQRHIDRWAMKLTPEGEDHVITRLTGNVEVLKSLWSKLPGFYWSYPCRKEKAGASVLLRSMDPTRVSRQGAAILLAAHFYGPGRTVFQSFDTSWRWRTISREYYQRYWIQLMRYLVEGRLLGGQRRMSLSLDKDGYELGDVITAKVKLLDQAYKPLSKARLVGKARSKEGSEAEILFEEQEGRPGTYVGSFVPDRPDLYKIEVEASSISLVSGSSPKVSKTVRVSLPNTEFADPSLDEGLLRDTAESSGGQLVALKDLKGLPDKIPARQEKLVVSGTPVPLWDNRVTLIVMVLLLSLEWWFRKRCRMV